MDSLGEFILDLGVGTRANNDASALSGKSIGLGPLSLAYIPRTLQPPTNPGAILHDKS